jgi:rhodanese-related sulfurtransferase
VPVYKNIEPAVLNSMISIKETNNFFLINTNLTGGNSISGTDAQMPYLNIISRQSELPQDKNARIVVYSKDGYMSKIAAQKLNLLGYTNVFNLNGGTDAFLEKGFKIK